MSTGDRAKRAAGAERRRDRIVDVAMRHFAEHGYRATRVEDIATEVGVAKGTVFLDFGSKEELFLAAYQRAVSMLPAWLDAPPEIVLAGVWATLGRRLARTGEGGGPDRGPNPGAGGGGYESGLRGR